MFTSLEENNHCCKAAAANAVVPLVARAMKLILDQFAVADNRERGAAKSLEKNSQDW